MGKASRWFKGLILKLNKPNSLTPNQPHKNTTKKKKWSFMIKSNKEKECYKYNNNNPQHCYGGIDSCNVVIQQHSCNTTACVGQRGACYEEELAAVTIQSYFRAYLSRRALRALKALVRLQALVRGHIIRKRTGDAHRQLLALVRAQTRARVGRFFNSGSPHSTIKSPHFNYSGPDTPEKFEHVIRARTPNHEQVLKRNGSKSNVSGNYVPAKTPTRRNLFQSYHLSLNSDQNCQSFSTSKDSTARKTGLSPSSFEVRSLCPLKLADDDESVFCTAENSPQYYSASSRAGSSKRGAFTPTKSESSRSCLSGHLDSTPSYMAYTESSKAKVRSLSAPKQRPQYERSSSTKRYSVHNVQNSLSNMVYPGSGRLDKFGMPVRGDVTGSSGRLWLRY